MPTATSSAPSREYLDIIGISQLPVPERRLLPRVHREDRTTLLRQRRDAHGAGPYRLDYRLRSTLKHVWYHVHERGFPRFDERQQTSGPKVSPRTFPNASPRKKRFATWPGTIR